MTKVVFIALCLAALLLISKRGKILNDRIRSERRKILGRLSSREEDVKQD